MTMSKGPWLSMDFRDLEGRKVQIKARRCAMKQPRLTQTLGEPLLRVTATKPPRFTATVAPATATVLATLARQEAEGASLSLI